MFPWSEQNRWQFAGFLLLILWFGVFNGWKPLGILLAAAAVHELGHAAVMKGFGIEGRGFTLSPFGAEIHLNGLQASYPREIMILAAGPGADLLVGGALTLAAGRSEPLYTAAGAFWILGFFNLLPVCPLDGGQILRLLLCWFLGPGPGERISEKISLSLGLGLAGVILWMILRTGGNLWLLPAAVCLLPRGSAGRKSRQRPHPASC